MQKISFSWMLVHLRSLYYKKKFNVKIGKNTYIFGPCEFSGRDNGKISFGNNTIICRWNVFRAYGGYIKIGNNCSINSFCHLSGNGGLEIGDNVRIATQCVLISANHNFKRVDIPITKQGETRKKIVIEDDCWIGAGVKVLMGVTIGKGSVIGAGSVITKDIPPYSVVVGVPGKIIRSRLSGEVQE
ncbi:acyltransferase [Holdemanella biformis]|uniref:acyltransferase n=1 Tax=Holdemanella biformis TaxID=1735 RepID=UPI0022E24CCE|nr:acyltransferase [Holdemanella biformis]